MEYFITEATPQGPIKTGPLTSREALNYVDAIGLAEDELKIQDESGLELNRVDLKIIVLSSEETEEFV